jgi:RloB-like protein
MGFGRDRDRRPGRRPAFRTTKKRILIVCEGANTEPQYLEQFAETHREAIVEVETVAAAGVPLSVVREAKKLKNEAGATAKRVKNQYLKYDSVWCAIDFDQHPNIPEALQMASRNGIKVALSNPCFELWLILHLRDAPGMIHRHAAQSLLKGFVPNYDKKVDYETYRAGYERAVTRARKLDELAAVIGEPGRNPTTGVYKLTETIVPPQKLTMPKKRSR